MQGISYNQGVIAFNLWLANLKAKEGTGLKAGMLILTGTLTALLPLKSGDTATVAIEGLGEASLKLE